ncbi:SbcC/MukB-like Walker B domain-containing protein [Pseudochelatococcus lubricantis]|uniref:SbcC/MukB-like Walker B domain-containing protein n=1 Tax=Pseudochelatococcus lubricantis TaxID=1538102 RepID=UPI0035E6A45A
MIHLTGISLVNWHRFTVADVDFAGNTAVLGKNATGKSTLIDLIQAVMAGGSGAYYRFNRSAGEGGSRSDRTLRSYCLGQTDIGKPGRSQCVTHLALRFDGGEKPVTIGLCIEAAESEEAPRIVGRYVVEGVSVNTRFFLEDRGGETFPSMWPTLRTRIEEACRDAGGALHEHQSTSAVRFIREYMRVLFTGRRAPDPDRFIKAFIMALSFEDMRSVEEFVRNYLIERRDINISELRESIQRYRQIQSEIAELERKLEALRPIMYEIERLGSILEQSDTAESMRRLADLLDTAKVHYKLLASRRAKAAEKERLSAELARINEEIGYANAELESVTAQIAISGVDAKKHALRLELLVEEQKREAIIVRLRNRHAPVVSALKLLAVRDRIQNFGLGLGALLDNLERIQQESAGLLPPTWPRNPVRMEEMVASAVAIALDGSGKVAAKRDEAVSLRVEAERRVAEIAGKLAETRRGAVSLDPNVASLIAALTEQGMKPRALCAVLEVLDERWRGAAEALLGRDREAVIVDPEHAERAISFFRRERSRFPGCRVANTRKLAHTPDKAKSDTLASMLSSQDSIAMAVVVFRLGNVGLAETQAKLISGGRAIMSDGTYYDGLIVEIRTVRDVRIGKVAARMMTDRLAKELEDERQLAQAHRSNENLLSDVLAKMAALASEVSDDDGLMKLGAQLADVDARRQDIADRIEKVSLSVNPALEESRRGLAARIEELRAETRGHDQSIGGLMSELALLRSQIQAGNDMPGSWWSVRNRLTMFREWVKSSAVFRRIRPLYRPLRGARTDRAISAELDVRLKRLADDRIACDALIRDKVSSFLYDFDVRRPFDSSSSIIGQMKPWVQDMIDTLEGNDLIQYRKQADEAAGRVTYLFRTSFVQELNGCFRNVEREIDDVRVALRSKPLHGEIYSLHAYVRPEFRDLYNLARASETDDGVLALLFSPEATEHPFASAVRHVETLLKDENASFERYQDYRNYYTFELRMKKVSSGDEIAYDRRRGTASGAERQVPFYVVIGAALSSIYHGTRRSDEARGMGLAVFDEAFSKMDGENQRTMLEFYNEIGLQVIIAAPTEKRSVVYENLDSIVDVYRFGDSAVLETSRIKGRVRQEMRKANPEHLSQEALLLLLAEQPRLTEHLDDPLTGQSDETVH